MKKSMTLVMCALLVAVSLVSGVFALYSSSLDDVNEGTVVAKNFVLTGETTQQFGSDVKIAPGETKDSVFTIKNFDSNGVTETAMDVTVSLKVDSQIAPLQVKVIDTSTNLVVAEANKTSGWNDDFAFTFTAGEQTTNTYKVQAVWPAGAAGDDNEYINLSASYEIDVYGVQKVQ